jgi:hypothetical protein
MTGDAPFVDDLRRKLVRGIERDARRRRRSARAVAVAGSVALAAAVPLGLGARSPDRALAISRSAGIIELRIADASAGAAQMTRELRAAGIDGEVRVVPVEPALVGRWAAVAEVARLRGREETVRLDRVETSPSRVRIPVAQVRESTGRFVFFAGRAPRAGEAPAIEDGRVPPDLIKSR